MYNGLIGSSFVSSGPNRNRFEIEAVLFSSSVMNLVLEYVVCLLPYCGSDFLILSTEYVTSKLS